MLGLNKKKYVVWKNIQKQTKSFISVIENIQQILLIQFHPKLFGESFIYWGARNLPRDSRRHQLFRSIILGIFLLLYCCSIFMNQFQLVFTYQKSCQTTFLGSYIVSKWGNEALTVSHTSLICEEFLNLNVQKLYM